MVFVPVAAVILTIWFACYTVDAVKTGSMRADFDNYKKASELAKQYIDNELENELNWKLKHLQIDTRSVVRNFMGGDRIWADYADIADGDKKAKLVLMAEHGRIPSYFVIGGEYLHLSDNTMHAPGPNRIPPARSFEMNEKFVLRAEQYLKEEKGVPVAVYCRADLPDGRKNVFIRVSDLRKHYGAGLTNYFTSFQFLHDSYRR